MRYANLLALSRSLGTYGRLMKALGWIVGGLSLVGGVAAAVSMGWVSLVVVVFGVPLGLSLHVFGIFVAAVGEGLLAVADIATNTMRIGERPL